MESLPLVFFFALLLGAIVGSFLNVVILRLPSEDESIVFPASHCPRCQNTLSWYENIPVISFLALRGRCRHCHARISLQYPIVELCMALLSVALVHRFGLSVTSVGYFVFCVALLVIIWIDIEHQIIPDVISLPGILLGFIFSLISPHLTWQDSLIGLLIGGGVLYAIALLYYLWKKQEGMGGGDIKLLAMIGAFLGWQALPFVIFASSLTGATIGVIAMIKQGKGGKTRIPFGPFLSLAALAYLFFPEQVDRLYQFYLHGTP
jgi:leader peptidase (prepilin peptidase)/N-methyltransferase